VESKANITKKFRPLKFSDVAGQEISVRQLTSALQKGIIPPAYLFCGTRGCGKTTSARLFAMSLNCTARIGVDPCGQCTSCKDILNDNSEYLIEVDGATCGKVEDVRNLMSSIRYVVPDGHYKVIIIDECHGLTKAAWDASLKTIEEPPPNVLFIFATTELGKVIPTIKSRCTTIQFPSVPDNIIVDVIKRIVTVENVPCEDAAIARIVKASGGSIRDAQTILEGFIRMGKITEADVAAIYQSLDPHTVMAYFRHILDKDEKAAYNQTMGWIRMGVNPSVIVNGLLEHLRNMLMDFIVTDNTLKQMLKTQRDKITPSRVVDWIDFFYDQLQYIRDYPMEYTLIMDLITIKLIDSLKTTREGGSKKKADKEVEAPKPEAAPVTPELALVPVIEAPQPPMTKLDRDLVCKFRAAVGGITKDVNREYTRETIQAKAGHVLDVVTEDKCAISSMWVLCSDVNAALVDFPANMNQYLKIKE
jgi:DNA polymerase III subunit gamma/tau